MAASAAMRASFFMGFPPSPETLAALPGAPMAPDQNGLYRLRGAIVGQRLRVVVAPHLRAAIEDLRIAVGDLAVQLEKFRVHVACRPRLVLEMMELVRAADEGRAVFARHLLHVRGDVAD